jgi:hypothetical protein
VTGRVEKSIGGVASEVGSGRTGGKSSEIALLKNDEKEGVKNREKREALGLFPAKASKGFREGNKIGEGVKFGKFMDSWIFLV